MDQPEPARADVRLVDAAKLALAALNEIPNRRLHCAKDSYEVAEQLSKALRSLK